jgi:hypothetical protein
MDCRILKSNYQAIKPTRQLFEYRFLLNKYSNQMSSKVCESEGIRVSIRMRPLNERELSSGQIPIFRCLTDHNAVTQMKDGVPVEGQVYQYDKVFDELGTTENVYGYAAQDIVKGVASGINGTIFACM